MIFVNIFGGIIRCDIIAQGIIEAIAEIKTDIPIVVRLQGNYDDNNVCVYCALAGNNVNDAKELFATSNVNKRIVTEDDFGRAAKLVSHIKLQMILILLCRLPNLLTSKLHNKAQALKSHYNKLSHQLTIITI